jgi:hypothetical protein
MFRNRRRCVNAAAGVVMLVATGLMIGAPAAHGASLPACPVYSKWPTKPVSAGVLAAVRKYYTARHLLPFTIYQNRESVLNVKQESAGTHWCKNPDGSKSGYVGVVPANATAAVIVHVKHKAYAVTEAAFTFATLAQIPKVGWKVVSDDTAP